MKVYLHFLVASLQIRKFLSNMYFYRRSSNCSFRILEKQDVKEGLLDSKSKIKLLCILPDAHLKDKAK